MLILLANPFVQQVPSGPFANTVAALLDRKRVNHKETTHVEVRTIGVHASRPIVGGAIVISGDPNIIARTMEN